MTAAMIVLLIIIAAAMVLFALDALPAELTALLVMLSLILTGILPADEAFAGFGSDTSIMILGILLLTTALVRTGVVNIVTAYITSKVEDNSRRLFWALTIAVSGLSTVINNTAAAAFFLPVTLNISKRLKINPSRLLMPLAFAAILSSSVTLIATSTNVVVSGLLTDYGFPPLGMFELTLVGLPILAVGLLYLFFFGQKLIPIRDEKTGANLQIDTFSYCSEVKILEESPWIGKSLAELQLGQKYEITVVRIYKQDKKDISAPRGVTIIDAGDRLILEGSRDGILHLREQSHIEFTGEPDKLNVNEFSKGLRLAEVILMPDSRLIGRTLRSMNFRERFGLQVLGINRNGRTMNERLATTKLRIGDQLLLQGAMETIASLGSDDSFRILSAHVEKPVNTQKALISVTIFVGMMLLAATKLVAFPVAVLIGTALVFLTGSITPQQAFHGTSWNAWLLICCMLSLGKAMEVTGLATFSADLLVNWLGNSNPLVLLAAFFILAMLLTQPMSNQAAAVVTVPIAIQTATLLGLNPRTFAIMIAVGAATSYITPLEPACMMVYGPGNYRFTDFLKVGIPLTFLIFVIAMLMVPWLWPL